MKILKIGCISFFVIALITVILSFNYGKYENEPKRETKQTQAVDAQVVIPTTAFPIYEKLSHEKSETTENFSFLVKVEDKSAKNLKRLALEIKSKECKMSCNISLFDDRRAAELDGEYKRLNTIEEQNGWKERNYIYVADHLAGFLEFSSETFSYYPYRDWYYEELKAKQQ
ncbi:hypothetical protein HZB78_03585 [Candidatus Collierbacteria bacterium]|nr:hypothetical protein [Candidatus Collierbacteria bacterium]